MLRLLLIVCAATLALAACTRSPTAGSPRDARRGADANEDGKITLDEARAQQRRMLDRFDKDHDGKLSFEEIEVMPARLAGRTDRMDLNGDREISADEMAKAADERFHRRDKNGDGVLTGDEMRFGRDRVRPNGERSPEPL